MRGNTRLMTGFWYEGRKCIRKSQLIDPAFRGGMCLTPFVYEAAERGVFTIAEKQITLTTLRYMKERAGLPGSLYVDE